MKVVSKPEPTVELLQTYINVLQAGWDVMHGLLSNIENLPASEFGTCISPEQMAQLRAAHHQVFLDYAGAGRRQVEHYEHPLTN